MTLYLFFFKAIWDILTIHIKKLTSTVASAVMQPHVERAPWFSFGFLLLLLFFFITKKNFCFREVCSIHCAWSNASTILAMTAFCLIKSICSHWIWTKSTLKYGHAMDNPLGKTRRLKGPWSFLSFSWTCYKKNFG